MRHTSSRMPTKDHIFLRMGSCCARTCIRCSTPGTSQLPTNSTSRLASGFARNSPTGASTTNTTARYWPLSRAWMWNARRRSSFAGTTSRSFLDNVTHGILGPWSREEVEAVVADYLHMLTQELAGQIYNKTVHRKALQAHLGGRSNGSIERKHQNISAILIELGCPYITGYKPLSNYQGLLFEVVADRVESDTLFDRSAISAAEQPAVEPLAPDFHGILVDPPALVTNFEQRPRP